MELLREGLLWLDTPVRYGTVAWLALAGTIALAIWPAGRLRGRTWPGAVLFSLAVLLTLVAFRWPAWFSPDEFNPDESQIIAGAITLREHPVYWEHVDGGTHGPVLEYLLVLMAWLGAPLNHATARMLATILQALALLATWRTLRQLSSERVARIGILPGLLFWAFISWLDFLHYGTELPGITLLALAGWALIQPLAVGPAGRSGGVRLFLGGVALGLIPLTKLQLIPLGASLAVVTIGLLARQARCGAQPWFGRSMRVFLAGLATPVLLLVVYLAVFDLGSQFWHSYVKSGVAYSAAGHHPFHEMPSWFFHFSATAFGFAWFFWGSLSFALLFAQNPAAPALRVARIVGWWTLGLALYCVLRPSREVAHYLHIAVIPLTLLCGLVLAAAVAEPAPSKWTRAWPWVAFLLLALLPQVHYRTVVGNVYLGGLAANLDRPMSPAAAYICERRQPGDSLAMWGWEPALFVETGLPQATREAVSTYLLSNWPMQNFYIDRYQRDLQNRRPTWFVDAVGPGAFVYEDRAIAGHETVAPIRDIIAREYELVADLNSKRIYRLKNQPTLISP
jgi:hypothetical protein